jgi:hypothetical protein
MQIAKPIDIPRSRAEFVAQCNAYIATSCHNLAEHGWHLWKQFVYADSARSIPIGTVVLLLRNDGQALIGASACSPRERWHRSIGTYYALRNIVPAGDIAEMSCHAGTCAHAALGLNGKPPTLPLEQCGTRTRLRAVRTQAARMLMEAAARRAQQLAEQAAPAPQQAIA